MTWTPTVMGTDYRADDFNVTPLTSQGQMARLKGNYQGDQLFTNQTEKSFYTKVFSQQIQASV